MIVRDMPDGRVLCIHQTSHALMAAEFCRYWGNRDFAAPHPYAATMLAISQHDNGWLEWELQPKLRGDGYPMDFIHDDDPSAKVQLWRRGVNRAYEQHPYAAVLIGRHAAMLYESGDQNLLPDELRAHIADFLADQQMLLALVRHEFTANATMLAALTDSVVDANTRLLQFGDNASLQVIMPWGTPRLIANCPVDNAGTRVAIQMAYDDTTITFDPWPYAVDAFEVNIHGRLLSQRYFPDQATYHAALLEAPYHIQSWQVTRNG